MCINPANGQRCLVWQNWISDNLAKASIDGQTIDGIAITTAFAKSPSVTMDSTIDSDMECDARMALTSVYGLSYKFI